MPPDNNSLSSLRLCVCENTCLRVLTAQGGQPHTTHMPRVSYIISGGVWRRCWLYITCQCSCTCRRHHRASIYMIYIGSYLSSSKTYHLTVIMYSKLDCSTLGPFNNYVTLRGGRGVKVCVTERSQSNVKKRYEGEREGQKSSKKALRPL